MSTKIYNTSELTTLSEIINATLVDTIFLHNVEIDASIIGKFDRISFISLRRDTNRSLPNYYCIRSDIGNLNPEIAGKVPTHIRIGIRNSLIITSTNTPLRELINIIDAFKICMQRLWAIIVQNERRSFDEYTKDNFEINPIASLFNSQLAYEPCLVRAESGRLISVARLRDEAVQIITDELTNTISTQNHRHPSPICKSSDILTRLIALRGMTPEPVRLINSSSMDCPEQIRAEMLSERESIKGGALLYDIDDSGKPHSDLSLSEQIYSSRQYLLSGSNSFRIRGTVGLTSITNNIIFPKFFSESSSAGFLEYIRNSYTDNHGDSDYFMDIREFGNNLYLAPRNIEIISGDVIWATPDESLNYGTWLYQVIPTLIKAKRMGITAKILLTIRSNWQIEFLNYFAPWAIRDLVKQELDRDYVATGRLFVFAQEERNFIMSSQDADIFSSFSKNIVELIGQGPRKIFVTRRTNGGARQLTNEAELSHALSEKGYTVVEPEKLSFPEQICLFSGAESIISLGGAALFNIVFASQRPNFTTIERSRLWIRSHVGLARSRGCDVGAITGSPDPSGSDPHGPWTVNVDMVKNQILRKPW